MRKVNIHKAKTSLSKLVARAESGEEIVIARAGKPAAKLVRWTAARRRKLGLLDGRFRIPDELMKRSRRKIESDVAEYWLTHDSAERIDWSAPGVRLEFDPEVERPTQPVTVRLPRRLLQELKVLAKDRDVPYQSFMKVLLAEKVSELRKKAG